MMNNLADMFRNQTHQAKQAAIQKLINYRIRLGSFIRVHVLEVITLLNDIEIMGALIDEETQVNIVFETLSDSFDTFKLNYSMNKLRFNLTELMKELQATEAHLSVNRTSRTKNFRLNKSKKGPDLLIDPISLIWPSWTNLLIVTTTATT